MKLILSYFQVLSSFSKALRHMMQAAYLLNTMPRPAQNPNSSRTKSPLNPTGTPHASSNNNGSSVNTPSTSISSTLPTADRVSSSGSAVDSPKHRSGSVSSIEAAWFTADAKLPALEAQVSVTLFRLLADHEGEVGHLRLAFQAKLDCADVLICSGRFDYARDVLLDALLIDGSLLLSTGLPTTSTSTRVGGTSIEVSRRPSSVSGGGSLKQKLGVSESFSNLSRALRSVTCSASGISILNYSSPMGGVWKKLRYSALKKILLCARILGDCRLFMDVGLRLLDPLLLDELGSDSASVLFENLIKIACSSGYVSDGSGDSISAPLERRSEKGLCEETTSLSDIELSEHVSLSAVLPAPMYPHLVMSISFNGKISTLKSSGIAVENEKTSSQLNHVASLKCITSIIHDEPFKVRF